jgi:apolipoprotein N-acyltransferase
LLHAIALAVGPTSFAHRGERIGVNICYEDLFGEELAARFKQSGAEPTVFANISNIGWFGNTIAIDHHLHISRLRALEFQRPMLRATNTGTTPFAWVSARAGLWPWCLIGVFLVSRTARHREYYSNLN